MNSARSSQGPHDFHARLLTIHLPLTRSQVSSMVSVIIESFKTSKSLGFDNINALVVTLTSKVISCTANRTNSRLHSQGSCADGVEVCPGYTSFQM